MKLDILLKVILPLFLISLFSSCNGQEKVNTKTSNPVDPYFVATNDTVAKHGPREITRNLLQDKNGIFWFSTWEGIISYDGHFFTNHTLKEGLLQFHTFSILEDNSGNIWFGTIGAGIYRYNAGRLDEQGNKFTHFETKDGIADDMVLCFFQDKSGIIWIGTDNGISCYDGKTFRNFSTKDGLSGHSINSIIQDKTGKIWIGTRYGENGDVCTFDGKQFTPFDNKEKLSFPNVRSIIEDQKGNIWIGGQNGLYCFNTQFSEPSLNNNVSKDFIGYLFEDSKGIIWISAGERNSQNMMLYRYDQNLAAKDENCMQLIHKENGQVFGIMEDKSGNIWFGTQRGACRYDERLIEGLGRFNCFSE
ncbi:MAG: ligand-binding sensor domain-containing protein [Saprospiraceae bacterium]